jgi:hypothetical protein
MTNEVDQKAAFEPPLGCGIRGWQPIETAPKDPRDETEILAWGEETGFQVVYWAIPNRAPADFNWSTPDGFFYHREAFTHWMPLPEAPNAKVTIRQRGRDERT